MHDVDWDKVSAVVSDVDETLIRDKSMFSLLDVYATHTDRISPTRIRQSLSHLAESGHDRDHVNRVYYAQFAGHQPEALSTAGQEWFQARNRYPGFWIETARQIIQAAREHAKPVALVSGSHRACLEPLAQYLGATSLLCTELETDNSGRLTGTRTQTAIGETKRTRLIEWATTVDVDLSRAIAMGDHHTDLPFLELVGTPIAVNPSRELAHHGTTNKWCVIIDQPGRLIPSP